jgi:hypothetical protein
MAHVHAEAHENPHTTFHIVANLYTYRQANKVSTAASRGFATLFCPRALFKTDTGHPGRLLVRERRLGDR